MYIFEFLYLNDCYYKYIVLSYLIVVLISIFKQMQFDKNIRVYLTRKGKLQNGNRNAQNLRHNHNYEEQKKKRTRRTKKQLKE